MDSKSDRANQNPGAALVIPSPEGWRRRDRKDDDNPKAICYQFEPPERDDVWLGYYDAQSGSRIADADAIAAIFAAQPHELSEQEMRILNPALRAFPFHTVATLNKAWTENINGSNVIIMDRNWSVYPKRAYELLFDQHGSGNDLHLIYFAAPPDLFDRYLPQAREAFRSIQWNHFSGLSMG